MVRESTKHLNVAHENQQMMSAGISLSSQEGLQSQNLTNVEPYSWFQGKYRAKISEKLRKQLISSL